MKAFRIAIASAVALAVVFLLLSPWLRGLLYPQHIGDQALAECKATLAFDLEGEYQKKDQEVLGQDEILLFGRQTNHLYLQLERLDYQLHPMAGWTRFSGSYAARTGAAFGRPISDLTNVYCIKIPAQLFFKRDQPERALEAREVVLRLTLNGQLTHEVTNGADFDASSQLLITNHGLAQLLQR